MSSNPRRTPVTRPDSRALTLKTNLILKKGATFHSPTTPPSSPELVFRPPPLPRRSQTNLDDVIDSHRRRVALTLGNIDKSLASSRDSSSPPSTRKSLRDNSIPIPRGVLNHTLDTIMASEPEVERRVLRPRARRPSRYHESDSGLGTSISSVTEKDGASKKDKTIKTSAVTRSAAARSATTTNTQGLSSRATNRIYEHTLKPLLAKPAFKDFHPLVLECPRKIQEKEIVSLRDLEKTLLLVAPVSELAIDKGARGNAYRALCLKERTKAADLYLDFCLTTIRCIQATVEYLSDREQTSPRDLPYTSGYFIDLVDQIRQYAQQLADAKENGEQAGEMDVDPTDEIKLHGGIHVNGRPAELVRVKKNGKAISIATGKPVDVLEEEGDGAVRIKRSASEELEDEEEITRSMARRKKNASPEELAPKKCREVGCNKVFKRPCDLTKHEKTHSRPWKCPVSTCKYHEYGWPTEKEMDRHHNDKHSSAPPMYECHFKPCPYKSKRESNCKQHMEKAHGWTYHRTKTNGKKSGTLPSIAGNSTHPTPQLQNLPTPSSDHSMVATPPDDWSHVYGNGIEFPAYIHNNDDFNMIPQEINIDYSPIDNGTPSTESSGMDHNSAYQDISSSLFEDIYSANVQLPTPIHTNIYSKDLVQHFAFTAAELCQPQPAHISPIGQGNAMLFTPQSLAEVDEGFDDRYDEHQDYSHLANGGNGGDFILFPGGGVSKPMFGESLFTAEVPSLAAGYSQPSSQDFNAFNVDWTYLPQ
ncbi:hypothetical protein B0T25DRAFT_586943 [Lasiosphaeria hispida]|uniref:C2H2-type domain-containing protein n=1 Tax=Lasiosphaeria hispida TaxID=260671 RepID=A0AAJ0HU68_9PEZI|nr:hypothetical protein B0T25DRAFT_586943 [Lasiosphaeria hispida]